MFVPFQINRKTANSFWVVSQAHRKYFFSFVCNEKRLKKSEVTFESKMKKGPKWRRIQVVFPAKSKRSLSLIFSFLKDVYYFCISVWIYFSLGRAERLQSEASASWNWNALMILSRIKPIHLHWTQTRLDLYAQYHSSNQNQILFPVEIGSHQILSFWFLQNILRKQLTWLDVRSSAL